MPRTASSTSAEIARLRGEIAQLTGRECVSRNVEYLRARCAALSKRKREGSAMPNEGSVDPSAVVSASLTRARVELLDRICGERQLRASTIMREAFDAWCKSNGYAVEIRHIRSVADQVHR
jgi:hypothetical protein